MADTAYPWINVVIFSEWADRVAFLVANEAVRKFSGVLPELLIRKIVLDVGEMAKAGASRFRHYECEFLIFGNTGDQRYEVSVYVFKGDKKTYWSQGRVTIRGNEINLRAHYSEFEIVWRSGKPKLKLKKFSRSRTE